MFDDFSLGENVVHPPHSLTPGHGTLSYDTDPYTPGVLQPRMAFRPPTEGATSFSSAGQCLGLVEYVSNSGKVYTIALANENPPTLRELVIGTGVSASKGNINVPSAKLTEFPPQMVECNVGGSQSIILIACGDGVLMKWDGTTLSSIASGPQVSFVEVHKSRVFAIGSNGRTLYFSTADDPTDWVASTLPAKAGSLYMPNFGEPCTGLKSDGNFIYIFFPTHIVVISGAGADQTAFTREIVPCRNGCVCSTSIVKVNAPTKKPVILYAGYNGFYAVRYLEVQPISSEDGLTPATSLIRRQSGLTNVPYPWIYGIQHRNVVWWTRTAIEGSAGTYTRALEQSMLSYTIDRGAWREHNPATAINGLFALISHQATDRLMGLSFALSALVEGPSRSPVTSGTPDATIPQDNNATKVPMKWRSPYVMGKGLGLGIQKRIRRVYFVAANLKGKVKVTPIVDGTPGTGIEVSVSTGGQALKVKSQDFADTNKMGSHVGIQIETDAGTASQNCQVHQVELYLDDENSGPRKL